METMHDQAARIRYVSNGEVYELAALLDGSDDEIEIGLSQLGIDPGMYSHRDFARLLARLAEIGCEPDDQGRFWRWTRHG